MSINTLGNNEKKKVTSWKKLGATFALASALLATTPQEVKSQVVQNVDSVKIGVVDTIPVSKIDSTTTAKFESSSKTSDPIKMQAYSGVGVGTDLDPFSAIRVQGGGSFFKGKKLQTNVFGYVDIDGNPLKTKGFGKLALSKRVYKGFNLDAVYTFTGSGKNVMRFGLSFTGKNKNGSYILAVFPMSSGGKAFDVKVGGSMKVGDNSTVGGYVFVEGLKECFYGETEFVHDFGKNIAGFVQARYGGPIKDPFLRGIGGIRLNIK